MDLRIEKTYRALIDAFSRLIEERRYEEITVAMLCNEAMIRRTTFYKHFADKAAFCSFFLDHLRGKLLENVSEVEHSEQGYAIMRGLVDFMLEHEHLVDNIFGSSMSGMMVLTMEDKVAETIRERYAGQFGESDAEQQRLLVASEFAAGGVVRLLSEWWASGHPAHGEATSEMVSALIAKTLAV